MQSRSEQKAKLLSAVDSALSSRASRGRRLAAKGWSKICLLWAEHGPKGLLCELWMRFWMIFAGIGFSGRMAARMAAFVAPPYCGKSALAWMNRKGYVSAAARIHHKLLRLGDHIFIDDGVMIYQAVYQGVRGGEVTLGRQVRLLNDVMIQTGHGGRIVIGDHTCIHPRCIISAYKGSVLIGSGVLVAASCAFYPYNHGLARGIPIAEQPLTSTGDLIVGDEAWIGTGAIILDGVRIGRGAVIGAGSVVTGDIPDNAIACGVPAKVLRMRQD